MKRLITFALLLGMLLFPALARADFVAGYLADCSAVTATTCTEFTSTGYGRQLIRFSDPVNGVTVNRNTYSFGNGAVGTLAGRAIYDAPTGGNLMLVWPIAVPFAVSIDQGDAGAIQLIITALAAVPNASNFNIAYPVGSGAIGTTPDGSSVTEGTVALQIKLGILSVQAAAADTFLVRVSTTGFSYQALATNSLLIISGAGTLATGTVIMPVGLPDGSVFTLACGVTVTSLTITPGATQTVLGSVTTCGPSVGHAWRYMASASGGGPVKTWYMLF